MSMSMSTSAVIKQVARSAEPGAIYRSRSEVTQTHKSSQMLLLLFLASYLFHVDVPVALRHVVADFQT
jgi:hypothetical protein